MIFISIVLSCQNAYRDHWKWHQHSFSCRLKTTYIQLSFSVVWKVEALENIRRIFLHFESVVLFVVISYKKHKRIPLSFRLIPSSKKNFIFCSLPKSLSTKGIFSSFVATIHFSPEHTLLLCKCNNIAIFRYFDKILLLLFLLLLSRLLFARTLVSISVVLGVLGFIVHRNNTTRHSELWPCDWKRRKETQHAENTNVGT